MGLQVTDTKIAASTKETLFDGTGPDAPPRRETRRMIRLNWRGDGLSLLFTARSDRLMGK